MAQFEIGDLVKFTNTTNHRVYEGMIKAFVGVAEAKVSCEQLPFPVVVPQWLLRPVAPPVKAIACIHEWLELQRYGNATLYRCRDCGEEMECKPFGPRPAAEPFAPADPRDCKHDWYDWGGGHVRCTNCGAAPINASAAYCFGVKPSS